MTSKIQDKENVNDIWISLKQELLNSMDTNLPSKQVKSSNRLPWISHKIRKMLKRKQKLYNQAKKAKSWSRYRQYQKKREILKQNRTMLKTQ